MNPFLRQVWLFIKDRFNLVHQQENEAEIVAIITRTVEFRGVNVWVLIFAVMVASIGLNVNSTAVVIGAMLISPLMGPIMGIGLALGITDSKLLRKGAKNLAIMVVISIVTSTLYFWISPLNEENSELLGRTVPTIWDVLIGFFGGMAGIVATASKERGNVIPGVAIATALMPPLCTAGFGLAVGNPKYFFGAFYLFSINTTFICLSTLLMVRFLKFHEREFVSPIAQRNVRRIIWAVVLIIVLPSLYIAQQLVKAKLFEQQAQTFVREEFHFPDTDVLKYESIHSPEKVIEITLIGKQLDNNTLRNLESRLSKYNLKETRLKINQGTPQVNLADLKSHVIEEMLSRQLDTISDRETRIAALVKEISQLRQSALPASQLSREAAAVNPSITSMAIGLVPICGPDGVCADTLYLAYVTFTKLPKEEEKKAIDKWLRTRLNCDTILLIPAL